MTRIRSSAECSMCRWKTSYVVESSDDPIILAHKSNETLDPMLTDHIREKHRAFGSLFEAGRAEGLMISDLDMGSINVFRGIFNVTHKELKEA